MAWEILFIAVFATLLVMDSADDFTGRAVLSPTSEDLLTQIEAAVPKFDFIKDADEASVCLVVSMDQTTKYSYEIIKIGEALAVTSSSSLYCKGQDKEDFIVFYPSYEKLKEQLDSVPTLSQLKTTSDGTNFYLYPSKQVLLGSTLANPKEFNEKFGDVLRKHLKSSDVQAILNPKTAEEREAASVASYIFYFITGIVVLVIFISVLIFTRAKKPEIEEDLELTAYLKSALAQGYEEEQIVQTLVQSGWPEQKVRQVLGSITSQTVPMTA